MFGERTLKKLLKKLIVSGTALLLLGVILGACTSTLAQAKTTAIPTLIRSNYQADEITSLCSSAVELADKKFKEISQLPADKRDFNNTLLAFENTLADLGDATTPLIFMGYVSTSESLRSEGINCEEKVSQFRTEIFSRKDLFSVLKDAQGKTPEENKLASETLKAFIKSGMNLTDEKLAQVKELTQKLSSLQAKYSENLNNNASSVEFTAEELTGVSTDFLNRLKKTTAGNFIVTTKGPDYVAVMENATKGETRHKMLQTYENREAAENTRLLQEAIVLRQQIAKLMSYNTWADYQLDGRMAKDVPTVMNFLLGLKEKLSVRNKADLAKFLNYKKQIDSSADHVNAWDLRFLDYQLKKRDFSIDQEKIKEYFPAATVIKGLFSVYSQILGVDYVLVEQESIWHDDVQLYEIRNKSDGVLSGYFFADLVPREGKYGHAAAFPLLSARQKDKSYTVPVAAMVANLSPPSGDKPSLLSHDDVETLFHEFGHIMHQTLTKAPYASLSGSSVAQDFVEAPSQMLENWAWDPEILSSLSGHYLDSSKKLPTDLLNQMIASKDFDQGYTYTRQLLFALFDMTIHSQNIPVDVTSVYNQMHLEIVGLPAVDGGHFPASFGHLMGGYDAGYYGYLWSDVYAADMFTRFQQAPNKLRDSQVGMDYKTIILEKGGMLNPLDLLRSFLGREPSAEAFYKKLNL